MENKQELSILRIDLPSHRYRGVPEGEHLLKDYLTCFGYLLAISLICAWQRQMNLPGRSAATLPALGRVGTGSMLTVFLICAMNG